MDCREFRELLGDEIDGRLSTADAQRLAAHVAGCAACADERRELASLRATFRAMPRPQVPAGFRGSVMEALPGARLLRFPRALGWIAAVAAVAIVAVTLIPRYASGPEPQVASASRPAGGARGGADAATESEEIPAPGFEAPAAPARDAGTVLVVEQKGAAGGKSAERAKDARKSVAREAGLTDPAKSAAPAEQPGADAAAPPAAPAPKPPAPAPAVRPVAAAEDERYVVFRDEAAALRFTASLRPPADAEKKDKAAAATAAAPTPEARAVKADALEVERESLARDLVKEASFGPRRVVARAPVPERMSEPELDAAVAAAGGRTVPAAAAAKFRELLDAGTADAGAGAPAAGPPPSSREPSDAPPPTGTGGPQTPGGGGGGGGAFGPATGGGAGAPGARRADEADRSRARRERVVVVVVLGPAPAPPPAGDGR